MPPKAAAKKKSEKGGKDKVAATKLLPPLEDCWWDPTTKNWVAPQSREELDEDQLKEIIKNKTWVCQLVPSARSTCRRCGEFIPQGGYRVGYPVKDRRGDYWALPHWLHLECASHAYHADPQLCADIFDKKTNKITSALCSKEMVNFPDFAAPERNKILEQLQPTAESLDDHDGDEDDGPKPTMDVDGLSVNMLLYQREGLHWLQSREEDLRCNGGILADEMGMGKTLQMISLILKQRMSPTLVLCPTAAVLQWRNEIYRFTNEIEVRVYHGGNRCELLSDLSQYATGTPLGLPKLAMKTLTNGAASSSTSTTAASMSSPESSSEPVETAMKAMKAKAKAKPDNGGTSKVPNALAAKGKMEARENIAGCFDSGMYVAPNNKDGKKIIVVVTTYQTMEQEYRKVVNKYKVKCEYCGKMMLSEKLEFHQTYFCGPDAQLTEKQKKTDRKESAVQQMKIGGKDSGIELLAYDPIKALRMSLMHERKKQMDDFRAKKKAKVEPGRKLKIGGVETAIDFAPATSDGKTVSKSSVGASSSSKGASSTKSPEKDALEDDDVDDEDAIFLQMYGKTSSEMSRKQLREAREQLIEMMGDRKLLKDEESEEEEAPKPRAKGKAAAKAKSSAASSSAASSSSTSAKAKSSSTAKAKAGSKKRINLDSDDEPEALAQLESKATDLFAAVKRRRRSTAGDDMEVVKPEPKSSMKVEPKSATNVVPKTAEPKTAMKVEPKTAMKRKIVNLDDDDDEDSLPAPKKKAKAVPLAANVIDLTNISNKDVDQYLAEPSKIEVLFSNPGKREKLQQKEPLTSEEEKGSDCVAKWLRTKDRYVELFYKYIEEGKSYYFGKREVTVKEIKAGLCKMYEQTMEKQREAKAAAKEKLHAAAKIDLSNVPTASRARAIDLTTPPPSKAAMKTAAGKSTAMKSLKDIAEDDEACCEPVNASSCSSPEEEEDDLDFSQSPLFTTMFARVVLDESHRIKSKTTSTCNAALALKAKKRWCISGTPLQNKVEDLYSLIRFIRYYPFAWSFCKKAGCDCEVLEHKFGLDYMCRHCGHGKGQHQNYFRGHITNPIQKYGSVGLGNKGMMMLRKDVLSAILLRRTKEERQNDLQLPPLTITVRKDEMSDSEKDFYKSMYMQTQTTFNTYVDKGTLLHNYAHVFDLIMRLRQAVDHPYLIIHGMGNLGKAAIPSKSNKVSSNAQICVLCQDMCAKPCIAACGHAFHRECAQEYIQDAPEMEKGGIGCPSCFKPLTIELNNDDDEEDEDDDDDEEELLASGASASSAASLPRPDSNDAKATKKVTRGSGKQTAFINSINVDEFESSTKIEALLQEIEAMPEGSKALVFSQFIRFLELIEFRLKRECISCAKLTGTQTIQARNNIISDFHTNPVGSKVLLVSLKAGGEGLNLQRANFIYIMDPWWNPAAELQAIQRAHRIGQTKPVVAKRFVLKDTIEEKILELQSKKQAVFDATVGKSGAAWGKLSAEDLKFLFTQ